MQISYQYNSLQGLWKLTATRICSMPEALWNHNSFIYRLVWKLFLLTGLGVTANLSPYYPAPQLRTQLNVFSLDLRKGKQSMTA